MSSDTLGTVLLLGAVASGVSTVFYRRNYRAVMIASLVAGVLMALAGIVFDSLFIKILGAYNIIMDVRSISRHAEAKEHAR